jgi:ornithine carbamoyltransferase
MTNPIQRRVAADLAHDLDLTSDELSSLLTLAADVKAHPGDYSGGLRGKSIALLFEKPSLRTRLTFELGVQQLGGQSISCEGPVGGREPLKDMARNLDRWVNGIVARVFAQETIEQLAFWSCVPVINALSERYHPCQALADMLTLQERFGRLAGLKLGFVGDGNNVAHSLLLTAPRLGVDVTVATPEGYSPDAEIVAQAKALAAVAGSAVQISNDPFEAVAGANAVYTDVWASMGQEEEAAQRRKAFEAYRIDGQLFATAHSEAVFMHCLPARRGEEVTDEVIEHERSAVFEQAGNRLHAQKALMLMMLA